MIFTSHDIILQLVKIMLIHYNSENFFKSVSDFAKILRNFPNKMDSIEKFQNK